MYACVHIYIYIYVCMYMYIYISLSINIYKQRDSVILDHFIRFHRILLIWATSNFDNLHVIFFFFSEQRTQRIVSAP